MAKINVLTPMVFNRIAAGEVVEKPCSVVKELVENSIDAGATNIVVSISRGGLDKIEITDNGSGIEFDSLKNALLPHATSKIEKIDDLDSIHTLGFRGEALASIASVSEVQIISKTADCDWAGLITCAYGHMGEVNQIASTNGTRIQVKNLFHNVPARLKFLRKEKYEENDITNYMSRLILTNPQITFTYIADGKTIYRHMGSDLKNALGVVYGVETAKELIEVDFSKDDMRVYGYISRPEIAKSNKSYQTLIVNGRYVVNNMVSSAIYSVYEDYLMKGKFPVYALCLSVPYDKVDVNIHPNKLDVKFEESNKIFEFFASACAGTLKKTNFTTSVVFNEPDPILKNEFEQERLDKITFNTPILPTYEYHDDIGEIENVDLSLDFEGKISLIGEMMVSPKAQTLSKQEQIELFKSEAPAKELCVLFDTYIVLQKNEEVYLVDQHAAHERINYDKLTQALASNTNATQKLTIPYILTVNSEEDNFLSENVNALEEIGFKISLFGDRCYRVDEVPFVLSGQNLKLYFQDIFKNLSTYVNKPLNFIKDTLCQKACKSSVKAGNKLSSQEISMLVKTLEEQNSTLLCPHGRPIIVKLSKTDIEKWFKRIV